MRGRGTAGKAGQGGTSGSAKCESTIWKVFRGIEGGGWQDEMLGIEGIPYTGVGSGNDLTRGGDLTGSGPLNLGGRRRPAEDLWSGTDSRAKRGKCEMRELGQHRRIGSGSWLRGCLCIWLTIAGSAWGQGLPDLTGSNLNGSKSGVSVGRKTKQPPAEIRAELIEGKEAGTIELVLSAKVPEGAWIYSTESGSGTETRLQLNRQEGVELTKPALRADREAERVFVEEFNAEVEKFYNEVTWRQTFRLRPEGEAARIGGKLFYQVCDEASCRNGTHEIDVTWQRGEQGSGSLAGPAGDLQAADAAADSVYEHTLKGKGGRQLVGRWRVTAVPAEVPAGGEVELTIEADLEPEWHIYSVAQPQLPDGSGPVRTVVVLEEGAGWIAAGGIAGPAPQRKASTGFEGLEEQIWEGRVRLRRKYRVPEGQAPGPLPLRGRVAWQACKLSCVQAGLRFALDLRVSEGGGGGAKERVTARVEGLSLAEAMEVPEGAEPVNLEPEGGQEAGVEVLVGGPRGGGAGSGPDGDSSRGEKGVAVVGGGTARGGRGFDQSGGLWLFLMTAAAAGFAALLTPCVFPMVPITVSFFQKQAEREHHRPITMALVYCLGIVGTFTLLGVVMSSLFGAASLNTLANNPWLNLFIAGVMVFFGLNLLGLFEITIPSFLLNYTSGQESRGGLVGVLFMALTFTLTSFTCTFAFVGWLLAMAANGARLWPVLGLLVFSAAFSLPFFFLALFPSWLKKLPKAGGWMNRFKVVMGLLEIGAAFKFLSVADLAWNPVPTLFDNELVLSAWIVLLIAMGIYLLGWVRLPHDMPTEHVGVGQFFVALSCLGLAAYMAVGLYGGTKPSGQLWSMIAAFAPPKFEEAGAPGVQTARGAGWETDGHPGETGVARAGQELGPTLQHGDLRYALDYRRAMAHGAKTGKPVFLEFTGVNCVNCRKMEQGPLASPAVRKRLREFVCVQVWMDQIPTVQDPQERARLLRQNRELQESWFDDSTMPAYVVVGGDPDLVKRGKGVGILAEKLGYDANAEAFTRFLDEGLGIWRKKQLGESVSRVE